MVGKVYLANIIYTDMSDSKIRPILILRKNSFGDYIYLPITSESDNAETIEINNSHFESGHIKKTSYLILDKLCSISETLLNREIGKVKDEYFDLIMKQYCANLDEKIKQQHNLSLTPLLVPPLSRL